MIFSSISAPFFTEYLAKLSNKKHVKWGRLLSPQYKNSKVFMLGLYFPKNPFWKKVKCKKMLITFSGSDILSLKKMKKERRDNLIRSLEDRGYKFASNGNFLKKEAEEMYNFKKEIGIIKLPSPHSFDNIYPVPEKFSVGVYMSQKKPNFYGYHIISEVMKIMKDVDFYFYSTKGYNPSPEEMKLDNFKFSGPSVQNMSKFLKNISCGLRITDHDAASMSAIEYNMAGRKFIFNHEMKHCIKLSQKPSVEEVVKVLTELKKEKELNVIGSNYYKKEHNINSFLKKVNELI